jgi:hypothetical protein
MRRSTILSLANALVAATLLIVLTVTTPSSDIRVTPQMIVESSKNTSPQTGLDLLSQGIEQTQHRATILKWLCYASLAMLVVNTICWALPPAEPRPD